MLNHVPISWVPLAFKEHRKITGPVVSSEAQDNLLIGGSSLSVFGKIWGIFPTEDQRDSHVLKTGTKGRSLYAGALFPRPVRPLCTARQRLRSHLTNQFTRSF
ncbi:hypothetical protein RRG08_041548 [Elysia crispata]|uniref:Uncharacterized protein n=1 Tax=Elysia crispata TaxID=231223 RepID=A0AAE0ZUN0_9GAST|nr:hypothetical protein RRG08_041548 [Elysia crispata]